MIIKPLRNNVVLKPSDGRHESKIGIIIASEVSNEAVIVAVGPEVKELKIGDTVRYDTSSSRKLEQYIMCRDLDVLCVIE